MKGADSFAKGKYFISTYTNSRISIVFIFINIKYVLVINQTKAKTKTKKKWQKQKIHFEMIIFIPSDALCVLNGYSELAHNKIFLQMITNHGISCYFLSQLWCKKS